MKIAIIGTHCSGKTSLCNKMYSSLWFEDYTFTQEPMREVARLGFKVNENADDAAQLAMVGLHLNNLLKRNIVSDRSLLDAYIYAKYIREHSGVVSAETLEFIERIMKHNLHRYNLLVLCEPEFKVVNDGFRSTDDNFRNEIHQMFLDAIKWLKLDVLTVNGNTEERYKKVIKVVIA